MIINLVLPKTVAEGNVSAFVTAREAVDFFESMSDEEKELNTIYALEI